MTSCPLGDRSLRTYTRRRAPGPGTRNAAGETPAAPRATRFRSGALLDGHRLAGGLPDVTVHGDVRRGRSDHPAAGEPLRTELVVGEPEPRDRALALLRQVHRAGTAGQPVARHLHVRGPGHVLGDHHPGVVGALERVVPDDDVAAAL